MVKKLENLQIHSAMLSVDYICVGKNNSKLNIYVNDAVGKKVISKILEDEFSFPMVMQGGKERISKILAEQMSFENNKKLYFPSNSKFVQNAFGVYVNSAEELEEALTFFDKKKVRVFEKE